jgi:Leucine-rich repeat (LRR) protein/GTPase SAR1 family protein
MKPEEVRRRIEECKKQRLTELNLSDWNAPGEEKLTAIPVEVFELEWLERLDLSNNQLNEITNSISRLQNLSELGLNDNQLSEIPDSISLLQNLSELGLNDNQLRELPDSISLLQNLSELGLNDNQLSELPDSIYRLQNLSYLDLSSNQLSELPDSISLLQNLSQLNLSSNQLSELPDSISLLHNLSILYLSYNQLSELPDSISLLQNLSQLDLSNNQLSELPDSITRLQNLSYLDLSNNQLSELPDSITRLQNLSELDLSDNPLVNPPLEIAERGIEAIREYFRDKAEGEDTLYEAKLIIVGEGGAGKTTLARKILDPDASMPKAEETTKGIDVLEWHFLMENDQDFRVNIWDFGGQEIYHATHQFFLTKRSLYLLVADSRKEHFHLDYWLNIIELLSENSPLLIIKNELENRAVAINEAPLRERFANLKNEDLATNLGNPQGGSGLETIKKAIKYHISQLPHIGTKLAKTWINVRNVLEQSDQNYISLNEYFQICEQNGYKRRADSEKDNRLILSQYFHDLGSILHFQEDQTSPLYKTVILKPKWGTDAAYKVLDNNQVKQNLGKFTTIELKQIWQDAEYKDMQSELLELMLKFKLCYPLPNAKNTYIAPQLLDANQPEYSWNDSDNLLLNYEYNFMPRGILTRFIVEMHKYIDEPNVWLTGVLLKRDDTWAEVTETYDRREIKIRLSGKNKRDFLAVITHQLDEIHDSFKQLKVKKLIPCNCDVCKDNQNPHFYDLNKLRERLANRKDDIECDKPPYNQVKVSSLIDDVIGHYKFLKSEKDRNDSSIIIQDNYGTIIVQKTNQGDNAMSENYSNSQPPIKIKSAWANGSFYLFVFVVVVAGIGFLGKQLDFIVLCVVVIAGVLFVPLIGALQLKQDDRLKDESFLALMKMVIGSLPLIGNPLRGILNPQKEDKN